MDQYEICSAILKIADKLETIANEQTDPEVAYEVRDISVELELLVEKIKSGSCLSYPAAK